MLIKAKFQHDRATHWYGHADQMWGDISRRNRDDDRAHLSAYAPLGGINPGM
jgi:hypothetical protein